MNIMLFICKAMCKANDVHMVDKKLFTGCLIRRLICLYSWLHTLTMKKKHWHSLKRAWSI